MAYSAVLLDIEGTVCPISFVKDVLFPFFLRHVDSLPQSSDPQVQDLLKQFETTDAIAHIRDLVARDVKDPILKQLQGLIWENGYASGEIKTPLYIDAVDFIQNSTKPVFIYSSGSVKAQKLLFQYCQSSEKSVDLRPQLKGYFDINTSGVKTVPQSYTNIVHDIQITPGDVLFISDNVLELDAAQEAGLQTRLAIRPGNAPVADTSEYTCVSDFTQL